MQALEVGWTRWLFVVIVIGLGLTLALFLGFYVAARRATRTEAEEFEEYPAGIRVGHGPIPPILLLVFAGMAVFLVTYVLYVWLAGVRY